MPGTDESGMCKPLWMRQLATRFPKDQRLAVFWSGARCPVCIYKYRQDMTETTESRRLLESWNLEEKICRWGKSTWQSHCRRWSQGVSSLGSSWLQNQILQDPTGLTSGKSSGGTIVGGVWLCIFSHLSLRPRAGFSCLNTGFSWSWCAPALITRCFHQALALSAALAWDAWALLLRVRDWVQSQWIEVTWSYNMLQLY